MTRPMRGLALSGGGFRATLFHLGLIAYLYDAEYTSIRDGHPNAALSGIEHIASVSGGSIMAGHLLHNWESYTNFSDKDEFARVACQLIDFIRKDIRGRIVRRLPVILPQHFASIYARNNFKGSRTARLRRSTSDRLERYYRDELFGERTIGDLGSSNTPEFYILATNIVDFKEPAWFSKDGFHSRGTFHPAESHLLANAVAASSAFPGMFTTIRFSPGDGADPIRLADGGIYDNLGVRRFSQLLKASVPLNEIIVSDAAVAYKDRKTPEYLEPITVPITSADLLFDRVYEGEIEFANRVNAANSGCTFKFLQLKNAITNKSNPFRLSAEYVEHIKFFRTDLNYFNDLEIAALVRHGYSTAHEKLSLLSLPNNATEPYPLFDPKKICKDKRVAELYRRGSSSGEDIKKELRRSSDRAWGLFRYNDSASIILVAVAALALCIGLYLFGSTISLAKKGYNLEQEQAIAAERKKTKVYLHISNESQRQYANDLGDRIGLLGFAFQGVENVSAKVGNIATSDIRFRAGENREQFATDMIGIIAQFQQIENEPKRIIRDIFGENVEIWLGPDFVPSLKPFTFAVALENDSSLTEAHSSLRRMVTDLKLGSGYIIKRPEGFRTVRLFANEKDATEFIPQARGINPTVSEPKLLSEWCSDATWTVEGGIGYFNCGEATSDQ